MTADATAVLRRELAALPPELRARLDEAGFREEWLLGLAGGLADPAADATA
ncbi:MAG: hypothetical protein HY906_13210, partial [Deltaproteobacteria bacterium]|nr:hypothetical protein [Deltaproteobacteria bacterium]